TPSQKDVVAITTSYGRSSFLTWSLWGINPAARGPAVDYCTRGKESIEPGSGLLYHGRSGRVSALLSFRPPWNGPSNPTPGAVCPPSVAASVSSARRTST